ncbi:MAG: RDD family protein [Pseudomonadota bacterium]
MRQAQPIDAGRLERLFAYLIDTILGLIAASIAGQLLAPTGLALIGAFCGFAAYYTLFTASAWQATPGKRLLSIYVIRADGRPLTKRDACERFLAFMLPNLPVYTSFIPATIAPILVVWLCLFWFAPILFSPTRQGFHDRLCHTRVIVGRTNR